MSQRSKTDLYEPSYSYIRCGKEADTVIGGSWVSVFDEDYFPAGSLTQKILTSDVTFTDATGAFKFNKSGAYHIMANLYVTAVSDATFSFKVTVNGVEEYFSQGRVDSSFDPANHTFQSILELQRGDRVVVWLTCAGANITVKTGTSAVITKISSDVYGKIVCTTPASVFSRTAEYVPFNKGGTYSTSAAFNTRSKGMTVSDSAGSGEGILVIKEDGSYVVSSCNVITGKANVTDDCLVKVKRNGVLLGSKIINIDMSGGSSVGPKGVTTFMIKELKKGDKITLTWDWSGTTGGNTGLKIQKGSVLLAYKLLTDGPSRSLVRQDNYINVFTGASSSANDGGVAPFSFNPFDADHYTDAGTSVHTSSASKGFDFIQSNGTFKLTAGVTTDYSDIIKGIYFAIFTGPVINTVDSADNESGGWEIKVNGAGVRLPDEATAAPISSSAWVDYDGSAWDRTALGLIYLSGSDEVSCWMTQHTQDLKTMAGCEFGLYRIAALDINDAAKSHDVSHDGTIRTFSPEVMSAQYTSTIADQAPFSLGTPGPLSLRGKAADGTVVIKLGDKKN
tara:strand:- start:906 stop:2594 length:1689 start_codon:yes stop_codon:yes gene_type:complete